MRISMRTLFLLMLGITASLTTSLMGQTAPGGRGGASGGRGGAGMAGAGSGMVGRGGRSMLADPRAAMEVTVARVNKIDEGELSRPPKRDYEIETGPTQRTKLFRADPKLFERKFVAKLKVVPLSERAYNPLTGDPRRSSDFPVEMRQLVQIFESGQSFGAGGAKPPNETFTALSARCPEGQRPEELTSFLKSAESSGDVMIGLKNPNGEWECVVYAPTADEATARAAAILRLYDCGASRPLQRFFLAEAQRCLASSRAACDDFTKLSGEITAEEEKIAKPSEVNVDILNQLKAQRVMVAVELAGLNARVKACDSMLNEPKRLEVSALQSISDMKVKAEIERIGTKEKLDQINAFIAEGDRREGIQKNLDQLSLKLTGAAQRAANATRAAETYASLVDYHAPRELEGNKIVVTPIEWTE